MHAGQKLYLDTCVYIEEGHAACPAHVVVAAGRAAAAAAAAAAAENKREKSRAEQREN